MIGPVNAVPGFFLMSGFSGHGFGIGPGAGRLMAELVTGAAPVVDPAPFRFERFNAELTRATLHSATEARPALELTTDAWSSPMRVSRAPANANGTSYQSRTERRCFRRPTYQLSRTGCITAAARLSQFP